MLNKTEKIILVGGGGHCKSCIDVIEQEGKFEIGGIIDVPEKVGEKILGYKVIGIDEEIEVISKDYSNFLITVGQIGKPQLRIKLFNQVKALKVKFPIIKSPLAYISEHTKIEEGTIIMHGAIINADAIIGKNCIINSRVLVEHDAVIGDHCHVSTGAIINGGVNLGSGSFFGSGAISKQYVKIPENSFIKANSIVK